MLETFPREGQYFCGFLLVIIREPSLFVVFVVRNWSWKRVKSVLDAGGGRSAPRLNHNITQENWIVRHAARFPAKISVKMAVFDENRVAFFWREEKEMALGDRWGTKEISYFVNFEEKTGGVVEIRWGENVINDRLLGRRLLKRVISTRSRFRGYWNIKYFGWYARNGGIWSIDCLVHVWYNFSRDKL